MNNRYALKVLCSIVLIVTLGMSMEANAGFLGIGNSASWQEEVLLHDGRKILVERSQSYGRYPTIDSRERMVLDEEWTFQNPANQRKVTWKVNHRRPPEGESLMLMTLGIVNGTLYIASVPAGCIAYNHWGRPNPPYVLFRFYGQAWQRISLTEFPLELKEANVVVGRTKPDHRSGVLAVADVRDENYNLEPHLRQIAREPVKSAQTATCEELVYYKGAWIMPNDPVARDILDRRQK